MHRRRLLPAALGVTAVGCVVAAALYELAPLQHGPTVSASPSGTPVLSLRRVPRLLSRAVGDRRLAVALDAAVGDPALGAARDRTCLVVKAPDGRTVYARQPSLPLIPASNLKLVTALATLDRLGADSHLTTSVRSRALPQGGVLSGDLWLVGGGDPLLATADYAATAGFLGGPRLATSMESLADRVAQSGVKVVAGRVLGDESRYDTQRYLPSWNPRYITDNEIGPMSALTVNDNFAPFRPRPVAAPAPAANAAGMLVSLLAARGVSVAGGSAAGTAPPGTVEIAALNSPPLAQVVGEMLRESDNLTAELLTKELGARLGGAGTTAAGVKLERDEALRRLPATGLVAVDGSGLDRSDRATCELFSGLLSVAGTEGPLGGGLPFAGHDGTLTRRFVGTSAAGKVRAKTGSLEHVVALSGWATDQESRPVTFSLLSNDLSRESTGTALEDKVVEILVGFPQSPPVSQLGPVGVFAQPPPRG